MSTLAGHTVERRRPWSDLPNEPDGTEVRATVVSLASGIAFQAVVRGITGKAAAPDEDTARRFAEVGSAP